MLRKKKGQSILEYIIVITAIVVAVIAFAPKIQEAVQRSLQRSADSIDNATSKLP